MDQRVRERARAVGEMMPRGCDKSGGTARVCQGQDGGGDDGGGGGGGRM